MGSAARRARTRRNAGDFGP
jgi:hypothetical protein